MQVYGPSHLHGPQSINAPHIQRASAPQSSCSGSIQDELQLSAEALQADATASTPGIRQDLVNSIRAQIADGTYETPEKLQVALSRMFDEIG